MKYENVVNEKEKLQKLLNNNGVASENEDEHQQLLHLKYKNYQLEQDIKDLKQKLHITNSNSNNDNVNNEQRQASKESHLIDKSFQEQIPVSDDHYKIPINVVNIRNKSNLVKESINAGGDKSIINSVENFQILPQPILVDSQNVLQVPVLNGKSTTTTTTTPTSIINKEHLAEPKKASISAITTKSSKKLPKFVLPIPDLKNDEANHEPSKESVKDEDNKKLDLDDSLNNKQQNEEINENENGAHEINDNNDFNIEEKNPRNHFDALDQDRNMINNAAEEFDAHNNKAMEKKAMGNEEMDLEIIRPPNFVKDKLKDEIKNDHGKEDYQEEEDLHIEQQEDDLGDSK